MVILTDITPVEEDTADLTSCRRCVYRGEKDAPQCLHCKAVEIDLKYMEYPQHPIVFTYGYIAEFCKAACGDSMARYYITEMVENARRTVMQMQTEPGFSGEGSRILRGTNMTIFYEYTRTEQKLSLNEAFEASLEAPAVVDDDHDHNYDYDYEEQAALTKAFWEDVRDEHGLTDEGIYPGDPL